MILMVLMLMDKKSLIITLSVLIIVFVLFNFLFLNITNNTIELDLSLSQLESNYSELTLIAKAGRDIQGANMKVILPDGFELVEGDLNVKTNFKKDEIKEFDMTIESVKEGEWTISAFAEDGTSPVELKAEVDSSGQVIVEVEQKVPDIDKTYPTPLTWDEWFERGLKRIKDPKWMGIYYTVCDVECFIPEPFKGKELNNYFKSLNLTEDYIYVIMQFDVPDADLPPWHIKTLEGEDIIFLGAAGSHNQYAKVPKSFLEEKSYDFIRWIGIMSPEGKLDEGLREKINCSGEVKLVVFTYKSFNAEQFEQLINVSQGEIFGYWSTHDFDYSTHNSVELEMDLDKVLDVASLSFVKTISFSIHPSVCPSSRFAVCGSEVFENIICKE